MGLSVATTEQLENEPALARIRFHEGKAAFYWRNPTSTADIDGDKVVNSVAGGRWIKTNSASSSGEVFSWLPASGSFTAQPSQGYILNLTGGDGTVTLPASPAIGTPVGIAKANATNYGTNRILVNRNGSLINGEAFNRQIVFSGQRVIFRFLGGAIGWNIESDRPVFYHGGTITSFAAPASLDSPQRGILDFTGKGFNAAGSWSNPFTSGNIRVSRYADSLNSSPSFLCDQVLLGTSVATTFSTLAETYSSALASSAGLERGFFHVGFRSASGRISQVRLNSVYWHGYVTNTNAFRHLPAWLDVYGSNDPDIASKLNYGGLQNSGERRYNLLNVLQAIDSKQIAAVNLSAQADWPLAAAGTVYRHRYINIASSEYFTDFIFLSNRGDVAAGLGSSDPPFQFATELEMYGDIQTIFTP